MPATQRQSVDASLGAPRVPPDVPVDRVVLSVLGPHAGESVAAIFERKMADIDAVDGTFWLCNSPAARPDRVQSFFSAASDTRVYFLAPATKGGARPTTSVDHMTEFSPNKRVWKPFPAGLGPVTGKRSAGAYAFALWEIVLRDDIAVDLWDWATPAGDPIQFRLGASTLLARRCDTSASPERAKTRMRQVVAVGRLSSPYAVWVR